MPDAKAFLDAAKSAVIADMNGLIIRATPEFCRQFHWLEQDLAGQPLTTIIPPALHDAHHMGISRYLSTGTPVILDQPLDLEILTGTGDTTLAQHHIIHGELDDAPVLIAKITRR